MKNALPAIPKLKARSIDKGYHSSAEVQRKKCAPATAIITGRTFQIVRFNNEKFNHNLPGINLSGHIPKKMCNDCHKTEFITDRK